jgi:GTP:adenosylcobinamide-phosphate guanylyltransferase
MTERRKKTYPVIMTAGDRGKARLISGKNKAVLDLAGAPVFTHVLAALEACSVVDRIYIVGPTKALSECLQRPGIPFQGSKPFHLLEQWENLYQNIWNAFQIICEEQEESRPDDTAVLVVPSDIPLLIRDEVEEFVGACDMATFDYALGLTSESVMSLYYPQKRRKGIRLMYFHTRNGSFRQNNLHMVKPSRMMNRTYIQKIYDYRLQREWGNIARLFWEIFRTGEGTYRMIGQYLLLHLASQLYRVPFIKLHRIPAFFVLRSGMNESIGRLLATRFTTVETHLGGAALDIDTQEHYAVIQENFDAWRAMQKTMGVRQTPLETRAVV